MCFHIWPDVFYLCFMCVFMCFQTAFLAVQFCGAFWRGFAANNHVRTFIFLIRSFRTLFLRGRSFIMSSERCVWGFGLVYRWLGSFGIVFRWLGDSVVPYGRDYLTIVVFAIGLPHTFPYWIVFSGCGLCWKRIPLFKNASENGFRFSPKKVKNAFAGPKQRPGSLRGATSRVWNQSKGLDGCSIYEPFSLNLVCIAYYANLYVYM